MRKDQLCGFQLHDLRLTSREERGGLQIGFNNVANGSINQAYVMKPEQNLWTPKAGVSFPGW